jgi:hypothetical protein
MNARVLVLTLALCSVEQAAAQGAAKQCKVDTSATWYAKQRAWFDDSKHDWSNDSLRSALVRAAGLSGASSDQAVQFGWVITNEFRLTDTALVASLRTMATTRGSAWPTRSVVGGVGTRAVWTIVQRDTGLARAALKRMMEAGPEESNAADVAILEDRLRLLTGRKQLYGSHFRFEGGKAVLLPTEDLAHVDLRREDAGLPPFQLSQCLAGKH